MHTSVSLRLVLGLTILLVACSKPPVEEERDLATESSPTPTDAQEVTSAAVFDPTNAPPPLPTALPTTALSGWQAVGSSTSGLQMAVPGSWVNLSSRIDTAVATNPLGLIVLLAADSERTGESLLNNKQIEDGAFAVGLISHLELPPNTPQATLARLTNQLSLPPANGEPVPVSASAATGAQIPGAYIDIVGDPLGFAVNPAASLQTRLFLFTQTLGGAVSQPAQAIYLFTAPTAVWETFAPTFNQIAETAVIHNINTNYTLGNGRSNVVGTLGEADMVNGEMRPGIKDVWTFNIDEPRYATITLRPETNNLDMTFSVYDPTGQTISTVDNNYAGGTEIVTDRLLTNPGLYVIEIGDFFNIGGRYTMSLLLTKEPLYGGGGEIATGQTIESSLSGSEQQGWTFIGDAGNLVTIVLTPEDAFDAILELYGPDGRQLLSLDEGYSGDAEVSTGFELPLTGQYTIAIRSFAGDGGRYALSLDSGGELLANFYDAGDLTYGGAREETLQPNEAHAWFFLGKANDEVAIKVTPLDVTLDPDVWLLDGEVNRLTEVNATQAGEPETVSMVLPADGQYIILVHDVIGAAGRYTIQLTANPAAAPSEGGSLRYGDAITGALLPSQRTIWYFDAVEGDTIDISLTPAEAHMDVLFYLYDPRGQHALDMDMAGTGAAESLRDFRIPINGRWGIVVQEFFNEGGGYTLTLNK